MPLYYLQGPIISAGQSTSNSVDCKGDRIVRVVMPDDWSTAPLTFQLSPDNVKFHDMFHIQATTGAFMPYEVIIPMIPIGAILVMPETTGDNIFWVRFRSGTRAQPIVQPVERRFQVVMFVKNLPTALGEEDEAGRV